MIDKQHLKSWAAGFIDGDGCFIIEVKRYKNRKTNTYFRPRLVVQVRRDNEIALRQLQQAIENDGYFYQRKARKKSTYGSVSKPTSECSWHSMTALAAVVKMIDDHPLMAKKAIEYKLWRKAVLIYIDRERPSRERQSELGKLVMPLREAKKYKEAHAGSR